MYRIDDGWGIASGVSITDTTVNNALAVLVGFTRTLVVGAFRDEFGIVWIFQRMLANLAGKLRLQRVDERLGNLLCHGNLIDVDADLSGIAEFEKGDFARRVLNVGILANHAPVASFAAQFQCHGREVLGGLRQHVFAYRRRAGVEDLVEALRQAHIGHVVTAVHERDELRREDLGDELLECGGAGCRLGAGLHHHGIAAADAGRHHAQREQYRKVERADDQRDAVGHLIDFGNQAGEAHKAAEVPLGTRPALESANHLVDFHNGRADVAEVGLHGAAPEVLVQGVFKFLFVRSDRVAQFLQLADAPIHVKGCARAEEVPLLGNDGLKVGDRICCHRGMILRRENTRKFRLVFYSNSIKSLRGRIFARYVLSRSLILETFSNLTS